MAYKTRVAATKFLRSQAPDAIGDNTLRDLASAGEGPDYCILNGRACYLEEDLLAWLNDQAQRSRRKGKATSPAVAT